MFGVQTLDGCGHFSRGECAAMGAIAAYLDHVGTGQPIFLQPPVRTLADARMAIDAATRESLELVRTKIGRASCRERVCQAVYISVVAVYLTKKDYRYR